MLASKRETPTLARVELYDEVMNKMNGMALSHDFFELTFSSMLDGKDPRKNINLFLEEGL